MDSVWVESFSGSLYRISCLGRLFLLPFYKQAFVIDRWFRSHVTINNWNYEERRDRSKHKTANHGSAKRRILLAAFSEAEGHGNHAENHRCRGH